MKAKVVIFGRKNSVFQSLAGKIQAFQSLVASKPVYLATMIPVPQNFCNTLKALRKDFIWSSKKPKIKHSTFMGDYCEGD